MLMGFKTVTEEGKGKTEDASSVSTFKFRKPENPNHCWGFPNGPVIKLGSQQELPQSSQQRKHSLVHPVS